MNYQRPQLIEELAAQYVLGTLRGPARRRFERYCKHNATRCMQCVAGKIDSSICLRTSCPSRLRRWCGTASSSAFGATSALRPKRVFATFGNWRFAAAAGIAALAIAFGMWTGFGPGSSEPVASIWSQQQGQLWSIEAPRNRGELRVAATDNLALDPARAYELWALPGDGAAPVSLGLMPKSGRSTLQLNDAQRVALSRSRQIAISLEPPGGSPTGAPTGPVLFVAEVAVAG